MEEIAQSLFDAAFAVDSIWSVAIRGGVWLAIALVIIVSSDHVNPDKSLSNLKSNLGFLLMFIVLSGGLLFMLFGFTSVPA
jgi:hypothetical protein